MPYVVPTSPTRTSPGSPRSSGSATVALSTSPPIPLSLSLSSPAPVPNFIPFPPLSSSSSSSRRNQSSTPLYPSDSSTMNINMSYTFPRRTTPLLKSQSEMSPSMIGSPVSQASSSPSPPRSTPSNSPSPRLTRRSASASSADSSPLATRPRHHQRSSQSEFGSFDLGRFDNNAGRGLARIPRRVGSALSASSSIASVNGEIDEKETPMKRRSRFVLGSEESGSDAEKENREKEKEKKEKEMEEREERKRPVSADRVRSLASNRTNTTESIANLDDGLVFEMDLADSTAVVPSDKKNILRFSKATKDESDSDCATPTPVSVAKEREADRGRKGREKVLEGSRTSKVANGAAKLLRRRSGLSDESQTVEVPQAEETSSVAFPSSSPPSPTLSTTSTATVQVDHPRSFAGKRSNAGSLHIDLPKTVSTSLSPPASPSPSVTAIEIPSSIGEGHHAHLLLSKANYSPPANRVAMVPIIQVAPTGSPPVHSAGGALRASASTSMVPLIRKKSGEVLKSSLKRRSSSASGAMREGVLGLSLSDLSDLQHVLSPSLSAPATPSAMDDIGSIPSSVQSATVKMVHFDAQLEHVKLFLAEQKPAAVSRDGSPTMDDTTSGGESGTEWDAFNYGGAPGYFNQRRKRLTDGASSEEEAAVRKVLVMRVLNMPNRDAKSNSGSVLGVHTPVAEEIPGGGEVWLEGLYLADDASCVKGTVRVRNIAFEKSVVVRFTFDGWQTTSEVSARWVQSCSPPPHHAPLDSKTDSKTETPIISSGSATTKPIDDDRPKYDRFEFAIRLSDLLLRIDEKTLVLAVRYCSGGREVWDNNNGQNYRAVFEKRVPGKNALTLVGTAVVTPGSGPGRSGADGGGKEGKDGNGRDNALGLSLQGALERIAFGGKGGGARDGESPSSSSSGSSSTKKNSDSLASRYDLGASLKNRAAWRPSMEHAATWVPPSQQNSSAFVFPSGSGQSNGRSTVPWPAKKNASYIDGLPQTWGNTKFPMFATHKVNFATRAQGLARGSPRDPDLDNLDDEALAKYQRRALGMSKSNMEEWNTALGPSFQRRGSNMSSGANASNASGSNHEALREHVRNHHRSYFDAWAANYSGGNGKARLTPPGLPHRSLSDAELSAALGSQASSRATTPVSEFPVGTVSPGRFHSFPPLTGSRPSSPGALGMQHQTVRPWGDLSAGVQMGMGPQGLGLGVGKVGQPSLGTSSEISTPSITSVSSPTMTPSPASPPDFAMIGPMVAPNFTTSPTDDGVGENGLIDSDSYSMFLNRFCFYTGRDALLDIPSDMRRSHSASSVEEFLSSPSSISTEAFPLIKGSAQATPTNCASPRASTPPSSRSANFESATSTPTPASLLKSESPLSTSVHG